jgi:glycosyltransferase involved in cell wall biosynthesis
MKILILHNYYKIHGGEEQVLKAEVQLLKENGHEVVLFTLNNQDVGNINPLSLAVNTIWNHKVYHEIRNMIKKEKPQIAHFHNTLPLISPAAYYACQAEGVAVVQTLHNYRMFCPNGILFRDGKPCMDCAGKRIAFPAVKNGCYRNSRLSSAAVTSMLAIHRAAGTWRDQVDVYIALTDFASDLFLNEGIPKEKIKIKPNYLQENPEFSYEDKNYALYVGRLSKEKGIQTLLNAWDKLEKKIPLKIVGEGPLLDEIIKKANGNSFIEILGHKKLDEIYSLMKDASFVVVPSECYETFGRVSIEAFACGTPVVSSNIGAIAEVVTDGVTGIHFESGNSNSLASKIQAILDHPAKLNRMRKLARQEFENKFTKQKSYELLMDIYKMAIQKGGK